MNILLPTDFSENAEKACEIAFKMAAYNQGTVELSMPTIYPTLTAR
jgi:hypothetical protein